MAKSTDGRAARVAALDLGRVRVGLAVSDELGSLAHPRPPLDGRDRRKLLRQLVELTKTERIVRFIVGWPLHLSGHAGRSASRAARFAQRLADATGVDVELVDERWSTLQAERELRASGASNDQIRRQVDGVAAALILQQWLDQHRDG